MKVLEDSKVFNTTMKPTKTWGIQRNTLTIYDKYYKVNAEDISISENFPWLILLILTAIK